MKCAKCGHENPETNQFCARCHAPARFTCPACKHSQDHGGQCDHCGVDFVKYATMLVFQGQTAAQQERSRKKGRSEVFKQILLLPITGGWSLLKYLRETKEGG
jgi:hypothetical protein